jgi:drug/metabolite transporter (DMT)-like permease
MFGSLALLVAVSLTKTSLRLRSRKDLLLLALSGALLAVHWVAFFAAIQVSTVAVGLLAFSTFPLFITFLEPLVFGDRLRPHDVITASIVVVGLIWVTPASDAGKQVAQGVLWGLLSAFTFAVISLLSRSYVRVYGILLAWLLLNKAPSLRTLCGGLIICCAVISASFRSVHE